LHHLHAPQEAESIAKLLQAEEEAKDRQRQHELEKTRLVFEQELERSKLTSQQRQEEKRERHRSELEKYERQMQSRERGYDPTTSSPIRCDPQRNWG